MELSGTIYHSCPFAQRDRDFSVPTKRKCRAIVPVVLTVPLGLPAIPSAQPERSSARSAPPGTTTASPAGRCRSARPRHLARPRQTPRHRVRLVIPCASPFQCDEAGQPHPGAAGAHDPSRAAASRIAGLPAGRSQPGTRLGIPRGPLRWRSRRPRSGAIGERRRRSSRGSPIPSCPGNEKGRPRAALQKSLADKAY